MNLLPGIIKFLAIRATCREFLVRVAYAGFILAFITIEPAEARTSTEWLTAFYKARGNKPFWFVDSPRCDLRRQLLLHLERSGEQGLDSGRYSLAALRSQLNCKSLRTGTMAVDHLYTKIAMTYLMDVLKGGTVNGIAGKDIIADQESINDYKQVSDLLSKCTNSDALDSAIVSLEPATPEYLMLKSAMKSASAARHQDSVVLLKAALNTYRRIHHSHYPKCIVVNVASGMLRYYEHDSLRLEMKVVTGKPSTPTPRFTAYCNEVILYPYWNVPRSIAVNELLPLCKKSPAVLSFLNMQVLDSKGNTLDPGKINWKLYSKENFPYRFRQATGCDNALGVIKFNLVSPYGVYLHDTNNKLSFAAKKRYFSHGCIRLEKPTELAGFLLNKELDSQFLSACLKEERPHTLPLPAPVPVFVVYVRADISRDSSIIYYDDI